MPSPLTANDFWKACSCSLHVFCQVCSNACPSDVNLYTKRPTYHCDSPSSVQLFSKVSVICQEQLQQQQVFTQPVSFLHRSLDMCHCTVFEDQEKHFVRHCRLFHVHLSLAHVKGSLNRFAIVISHLYLEQSHLISEFSCSSAAGCKDHLPGAHIHRYGDPQCMD